MYFSATSKYMIVGSRFIVGEQREICCVTGAVLGAEIG